MINRNFTSTPSMLDARAAHQRHRSAMSRSRCRDLDILAAKTCQRNSGGAGPQGCRGRSEHVAAMRACWAPDPVEFHGEHYQIPMSMVGPKPSGNSIPLFFGAMTRHTIERAARIGDGFITVAVNWDDTRTHVRWYREAGGTGTVVVNAIQVCPDDQISPTAFTGAVLHDLDRAAAVGVDEMHITLNLQPVRPEQQIELLEALASKIT
jgi:luciferase-like monooxygenase